LRKFNPRGTAKTPATAGYSSCVHRQRRNLTIKRDVISADAKRRKCTDRPFKAYDLSPEKGSNMFTKSLTALAVAGTLAVAAIAAPQPAEARGGRIAAGIIGGLAAGAIIGGIASNGYGYYGGPAYAYGPGPAYYRGPDCYWTRQRVWDGWGWRLQRVRVCG
jgi:hypothetical protein